MENKNPLFISAEENKNLKDEKNQKLEAGDHYEYEFYGKKV